MAETFQRSVVYQIYPKSYCDSDGDGLGDLRGVIHRLDHVAKLGANYIWLNPFFVSPQKDNGYDVADYYNIDPAYGTMGDLDELIVAAQTKGIGLMFDMVFNHVSIEHEWFQKAIAGERKYQDYFIFREPKPDGSAPTNWVSKFGGSAWEYLPELGKYYLHLFDVTQADLNWENPELRAELYKILDFWIAKGIKGFRFDVVNLISKEVYEDDFEGDGRRFYTDGPRIHEFLQEMNQRTFGGHSDIITVGEMSSTSMEACYRYAGAKTEELSMVFNFHHLKVDFAGNEKWVIVPPDFAKLKRLLFSWQTNMADNDAWNALFWCCHDQPRVVSRFGDEGEYWKHSAKMLGGIMHCLRGTPYVFQGEELGMTNADYTSITQFNDVESRNAYEILLRKGVRAEDALRIIQIHSRDNARTPMQWDDSANAGFSLPTNAAAPWLEVNTNYPQINASSQYDDEDSIFNFYRRLVALRKDSSAIAFGNITPVFPEHEQVFAYERSVLGEQPERLLVVANFYGYEASVETVGEMADAELLLTNYEQEPASVQGGVLRPYEFQLWKLGAA
ncbi:MAG: alpha,alpha-phosphotrehalase [Corynebacterium sp.]|nr:alpha,alpha-phosphotrehalase [Corynebacterium sp.]